MKILISGGHITPALAVVDYIGGRSCGDKVVFVGRRFSQDQNKQLSIERHEMEKRRVKFVNLQAPRWVNSNLIQKPILLFLLLKSVSQALTIVKREKPDVFLSFGGYLAVPIAIACWLKKVPIVTHEQTKSMGKANRFIVKLATRVALSFSESVRWVSPSKVVLTGNPIRKQILKRQPRPSWLPKKITLPILLVMGGNQGSKIINTTVSHLLPQLVEDWLVIHQCGQPTKNDNYLQQLEIVRSKLEPSLQTRYQLKEWIDEADLFWIYQHALGVVSRSGANSVLEIALSQLPSILIPLPFSHNDEQYLNAHWLVEAGGAILLEQSALTPATLLGLLAQMQQSASLMREHLGSLYIETEAAQNIYQLLVKTTDEWSRKIS